MCPDGRPRPEVAARVHNENLVRIGLLAMVIMVTNDRDEGYVCNQGGGQLCPRVCLRRLSRGREEGFFTVVSPAGSLQFEEVA